MIDNIFDAEKYFKEAMFVKKKIFVSYSGDDLDTGASIINRLKTYFKTVFDYKDKESIPDGAAWMIELGKSIADADIGICILSHAYVESKYCLKEAQLLLQQHYKDKLKIHIIKIAKDIKTPVFLSDLNYIRAWDYNNLNEIVDEITNKNR